MKYEEIWSLLELIFIRTNEEEIEWGMVMI